jgi:hypothetical protein
MRQKSGIKLGTILIGIIMFISILLAIILTAYAANEVTYLDEYGVEKTCDNYTLVNSTQGDAVWGITGQTTWYAVIGSVSITGQVTLYGDVHLICYRRNKNGQITGPENGHLTPSRGLTSASERRKPLFLRLPGVFFALTNWSQK